MPSERALEIAKQILEDLRRLPPEVADADHVPGGIQRHLSGEKQHRPARRHFRDVRVAARRRKRRWIDESRRIRRRLRLGTRRGEDESA